MARGAAIVVHAEDEGAPVRVGEGGHVLRDEVAHLAPVERLSVATGEVPERLELKELPLLTLEKAAKLRLGQDRAHGLTV